MIDRNEAYSRLAQALANEKVVAFIGAGCSAAAGYPGWHSLLLEITHAATAIDADAANKLMQNMDDVADDYLVWAERCADILGKGSMQEMLARIFGPDEPEPTNIHNCLIRLPFKHYLTTNYDRLLQVAQLDSDNGEPLSELDLGEDSGRSELSQSLPKLNGDRHICHVHGSIRRPEGMVLTLDDYNGAYERSETLKEILKAVFNCHHVVFIGFSLEDLHVMGVFRGLMACLKGSDHFAILQSLPDRTLDSQEEKLHRTYGINSVYYPGTDSEDHAQLPELLNNLIDDVNAIRRSNVVTQLTHAGDDIPNHMTDVVTRMLYGRELSCSLGRVDTSPSSQSTDNEERCAIDVEIEKAFEHITEGAPKAARALFSDMLQRYVAELTPRLRYRIHANMGHAFSREGSWRSAANEYDKACEAWPESRDAQAIGVTAYLLRHNYEQALLKATTLCEEHPDFARAHSLRLRALPDDTSFRDARHSVPVKLRRDTEVALVLSSIAHNSGLLKRQEQYARMAFHEDSEWTEAGVNLAVSILVQEKRDAVFDKDRGYIPQNLTRIEEAKGLLDAACDSAPAKANKAFKGSVHYNRSTVMRMLGDIPASRRDTIAAYECLKDSPDVVAAYAAIVAEEGDTDAAIEIIKGLSKYETHRSTSCFCAALLYERRRANDLEEARSLLLQWTRDEKLREKHGTPSFLGLLVDVLLSLNDKTELDALITRLSNIPALLAEHEWCRIRILLANEDLTNAEDMTMAFQRASDTILASGHVLLCRDLALLAEDAGQAHIAFQMWKHVVDPRVCNSDTIRFLRLAYQLGEDIAILDMGQRLRDNGWQHPVAIGCEVDALVRCREWNAAVDLLLMLLEVNPDGINTKRMRLYLSHFADICGRDSVVVTDLTELPSVQELDNPEDGIVLVDLLLRIAKHNDAIEYVYAMWRKFGDDDRVQQLLIAVVMQAPSDCNSLATPDEVNNRSAVIIQKDGQHDTDTVIVLEDGFSPRSSMDEFSTEHETGKAVLGRKVGNSVELSGHLRKIIHIQNKIVYRMHACLRALDRIAPEDRIIERFETGPDLKDTGDLRATLGEVASRLDKHEQRLAHFEEEYDRGDLSVSTFAKRIGRSVWDTMDYLARRDDGRIKTATRSEPHYTYEQLCSTEEVVIDSIAVGSLLLLDLGGDIRSLPHRLIVPESLLNEMRHVLRSSRPSHISELRIGNIDGQTRAWLVSREAEEKRYAALEEMIRLLERECEVIGGRASLEIPSGIRDGLNRRFDAGVVDAIAIAESRNALLWTDDMTVGEVAAELGIKRVSTQSLLSHAVHANSVSFTHYADVLGDLLLYGYCFTRLSPLAILEMLRKNGWNCDKRLSRELFRYIGNHGVTTSDNVAVTLTLISMIWSECPTPMKAREVMGHILCALGRDTVGPVIAKLFYRTIIPEILGPKFHGLRKMLQSWQMTRQSKKMSWPNV